MVAYVIARISVTDPEDYATYASQTVALAEKAGAKFLAKGGPQVIVEGDAPDRHVIVEFPSIEDAQAGISLKTIRKPCQSPCAPRPVT